MRAPGAASENLFSLLQRTREAGPRRWHAQIMFQPSNAAATHEVTARPVHHGETENATSR
jgi:hypothetical protein